MIDTKEHGHIPEQGDLILFEDGRGFVLGFFEGFVDEAIVLVGWGDSQRVAPAGSYLVGKKKYFKPNVGKFIGHRFENIDEVRTSLGTCGKVPLNDIEVT